VRLAPRGAADYLRRVETDWLPLARRLGMQLVGAYASGLGNAAEAILIWALRDFDHWQAVERANADSDVARWRASLKGVAHDWRNVLLFPGPQSPLQSRGNAA
jgi:hypothetical protein